MARLLRTFLGSFTIIATVVGLYLGALSVDLLWVFWITVPTAMIFSIAKIYGKTFFDWVGRIRNYNNLLRAVADEKSRAENAERRLDASEGENKVAYQRGFEEGCRRVYGHLMARGSALEMISVSLVQDQPQIHATWRRGTTVVGARFNLENKADKSRLGIVEVESIESNGVKPIALLTVVERTDLKFWTGLIDRARLNESPPTSARLTIAGMPDEISGPWHREEQQPTTTAPEIEVAK